MIVDDNEYACALAAAQLKKLGVGETTTVSSGVDAVLELQNNEFDALLLDWYMPDVSGAGLLGIVRDPRFRGQSDIPVVVMTAYASNANIKKAFELGANEVIAKPLGSTELGKAIANAILRNEKDLLAATRDLLDDTVEEDEVALL